MAAESGLTRPAPSVSPPSSDTSRQRRFIDRFDPTLVNVVTVLGLGIPVLVYFWLIHHYSVNVISGDQWDNMTVIRHSYSNLFDWSVYWAQHNEHRIFFPNLVVVLLSRTTHLNIQFEEYLSGLMLTVATAQIIWAHKRRSPSTPWLYYCPVGLLAFSVVQFGNTLWGFQMSWFLVLLALTTALFLLDRAILGWLTLIGAIAAGVVGSFSSFQGLLIWPTGLVLLVIRRRAWPLAGAWALAGVGSIAFYFYDYTDYTTWYAWEHPLAAAKFYLYAVGNVLGVPSTLDAPPNKFIWLTGLVLVGLAVATIVLYGIRRDSRSGSPVGVALTCMGLLFAGSITQGRILFGYVGASQSRYTTFDLLIPIGIYLTLLGRPTLGKTHSQSAIDHIALPVTRIAILAIIALQVVVGFQNGIKGAKYTHSQQSQAAHILSNINHASDGQVELFLYPGEPASYVRSRALTAEKYHLSLFDYGEPSP